MNTKPIPQADLSAIPFWNSITQDRRHGGTMVAPDLVLFVKHWPLPVGTQLKWCHGELRSIARLVTVGPVIVGVLNQPIITITPLTIATASGSCWRCLLDGTVIPLTVYDQGDDWAWKMPMTSGNSGQPILKRHPSGQWRVLTLANTAYTGPKLPSLKKIQKAVKG